MIGKFRTFMAYRELLWVFSLREIQIRYKQSILGITWAILQPAAMALAFWLIFGQGLGVSSGGRPYLVFSYSGVLLWTFFANSLSRAIPSLEVNAPLIRKIYFPREFFPMSSVLGSLFDFVMGVVVLVGLMAYYHQQVHLTANVLYVVPILIIQMVFTFGLCFFTSAVNVYYRDIKYALPFLIQIWMFVSPVIYDASSVKDRLGRFGDLYYMNPMAGIIDNFRTVTLDGAAPNLLYLGIAAAGSVFLFIVSYLYFKRVEMEFADVV